MTEERVFPKSCGALPSVGEDALGERMRSGRPASAVAIATMTTPA